jgi:MFS family permease
VFSVVFAATTVASFNQAKVPPLIPVLRSELGLSSADAGLLMSVYALSGLVLALPTGLLFRRVGPRATGMAAVGTSAGGALMGMLAPDGGWLLASRLLEGVGMGTTAILGISTIAAWFPARERGLPIGIYTSWQPLGNLGMLLLAPPLYEVLGWRAVWAVGGLAALACTLGYAVVVGLPAAQTARGATASGQWHRALLNAGAWMLAVAFGAHLAARIGFLTWAPTYLASQGGLGLAAAAQMTALNLAISLPASVLGGWLTDVVGSRKLVYSAAFLVLLPGWALTFQAGPEWVLGPILLTGLITAVVPAALNAATPETAREPGEVAPAVGVVAIGRNAGQVLGPGLLGMVLEIGWGWDGVSLALLGITATGLIAGWLARVR